MTQPPITRPRDVVRLADPDAAARTAAAMIRRGADPDQARTVAAARARRTGPVAVGATMQREKARFEAALREAEEALKASGVFERNEQLARDAEFAAAAAARRRTLANLRIRGVALKHARVLAGVLPLEEPGVGEDGRPLDHVALHYARRWGRSTTALLLVLSGPKGCGKSLAAAEQVLKHSGRSIPSRLLLRHGWWYSRATKDGSPIRSPVTRMSQADLLSVPLLVIDDVGQEAAEDKAQTVEVLDHLICCRCDAGLRTVVTTNFAKATREQLKGKADGKRDALAGTWEGFLGDRRETIAERVLEYGAVIPCPDEGLRHAEAEARRKGGSR